MKRVCVYCKSKNTINYGKQNGKQRFKCKECKRTFNEDNDGNKHNRTINKVLQLLHTLLYKRFDEFNNLSKAIEIAEKSVNIKKLKINKKNKYQFYLPGEINNNISINCSDAKLLISATGNEITFYKLPPFKIIKNNAYSDKARTRTITITDKYCGTDIYEQDLY